MSAFNSLADLFNETSPLQAEDTTLPYDIRAEIDWVDFSCTSNPLGTPERVTEAIRKALVEGDLSFYPNKDGAHLCQNLSRFYEMRSDCFLAGTSASAMVSSIAQAFRPCNVGIPSPAPAEYYLAIANVGHNPIKLSNPFSLSAIEPQQAFKNGMKFEAAVLANPSFPCARLLDERTLINYLETCNWVVVDESRINLTLGGQSFVNLTQKYKNLLVIRSISHDIGMPGIPVGYLVGHEATIKHIKQFYDPSTIGMFHEIVACELPYLDDYVEETNNLLDAEIPWMQTKLSLINGIKIFPSEANFVMCSLEERISRDAGIMDASDLIVRLQKAGYTVRNLEGVPGVEGKRFFLVAIRAHEENVRFVQALRDIISKGYDTEE